MTVLLSSFKPASSPVLKNLQQPKYSSAHCFLTYVSAIIWSKLVTKGMSKCCKFLQPYFFKLQMQFCYSVYQKRTSHIQCEMSTYYRKSFTWQLMYQCPTFTPACYSIYDTCLRASSYLICCRRNTAFFRSSCMLARFSSAPSIDFTALKNNTIVGEG